MPMRWSTHCSRSAASPRIWPTSCNRSTSTHLSCCRAAASRLMHCLFRALTTTNRANRRTAMTDTWRTLKAWPELILEQLADAGVALVAAWFEALDIVRADREIKVVITKGAGICFSSGLDLHFLRKVSEEPRDWDRPTP